MNTKVIYYRTDVFEEYGLELPDTWDDVRDTLCRLSISRIWRYTFPSPTICSCTRTAASITPRTDGNPRWIPPRPIRLFKELVELYTHLGVPVSANFLNRFRTGEMPVGIDSLGFYMTLSIVRRS